MLSINLLSIGDELTTGQTVDTNSAWLARQVSALGGRVLRHLTVSDDQADIVRGLRELVRDADVVLVTGGLGPTDDDLTRQAVAELLDQPLETDEAWLAQIRAFFDRVQRPMPEKNRIQACFPRGARAIHNTNGTAAGIHAVYERRDDRTKPPTKVELFVMPGVPKEMFAMYAKDVEPALRARAGGSTLLIRTIHTFGQGESAVAEKLGSLMDRSRNPTVGTTVSGGIVSVRIYARAESPDVARRELADTERLVSEALGELVFGVDDQTLHGAVAQLLTQGPRKLTIATAESCTGGLLAKYLTDLPGSSAYYKSGFITYSNQSKYDRLGVNLEMLNVYGAVSEPVVTQMARSARRLSGADYALAISGVAGPDGGSPTKPVGTTCIALAHLPHRGKDPDDVKVTALTVHLPGDREMVRDRAAKSALNLLRLHLLRSQVESSDGQL